MKMQLRPNIRNKKLLIIFKQILLIKLSFKYININLYDKNSGNFKIKTYNFFFICEEHQNQYRRQHHPD